MTNNGQDTAFDVAIEDIWPAGAAYGYAGVSSSESYGRCYEFLEEHTLICSTEELRAGQTAKCHPDRGGDRREHRDGLDL